MIGNKICKGNLMKEGVIMWAVFTKEGKAALRMDYEVHPENGKVDYGRLLSPDVPVLHEILMPDDTSRFLSLPEYGVSVRIRIRLRYPETEDSAVKQSEYEPETCIPAWIVPEKNGRISLYLQEPSTGTCSIPDMVGIPGLPKLQPETPPVKLEMLIRQAHCIFDMINPYLLKINRTPDSLKAVYSERYADLPECYAEIFGEINRK